MTDSATQTGLATSIVIRVGIPMAGAMWALAELTTGLVVSEMEWSAMVVAFGCVFVAFNQGLKIADDYLNDIPEDVIA